MNKKCTGCGALLQIDKPELEGYVEPNMYEKSNICRRCFRLKFYGDYIFIHKSDEEYDNILKRINQTGDLVLFMVDMFNISDELINIDKRLNNPMILVLTKRDLLPRSIKEDKIMQYLKSYKMDLVDIICVSSANNYNIDKLYKLIMKYKKSDKVYIVGNTNAGKSSLINKMIQNYSNNKSFITTSMLPSTTLDIMEIKLNDKLTIIDTPGLIEEGNIVNSSDYMTLKHIIPRNEIRPRTYQIEPLHSLVIENIAQIDYQEGQLNSFTLYISNELNINSIKTACNLTLSKYKRTVFEVDSNEDIVISGMGWIKITKPGIIAMFVSEKVKVYKRKSII